LCQSLPTYGVTFFLVKGKFLETVGQLLICVVLEKVPGKNRLIPRLLGVNKESVMRVDEKSKAVLKEWPLEQVRRWAAAPKTFTLVSLVVILWSLILPDPVLLFTSPDLVNN
jgi:talin